MNCSKEINDIFNKWRLQQFSSSFDNQATEQRPEIHQDGHFHCDKCSAKFRKLKCFKSHIKHSHIKPYKCKICSYSCGGNFRLLNLFSLSYYYFHAPLSRALRKRLFFMVRDHSSITLARQGGWRVKPKLLMLLGGIGIWNRNTYVILEY